MDHRPDGITTAPQVIRRMAEPIYPRQAILSARGWLGPNRTVGSVHLTMELDTDCSSCGGEGNVFLRFLRDGPTPQPRAEKEHANTWLPSSPVIKAGWWVIERTDGYLCPHCHGTGLEPIPLSPDRRDRTAAE